MTGVLDDVTSGRYQWPRQVRRRRIARVTFLSVAIPACVVALIVTWMWWFRGGTFLRASGGGYGKVGVVNKQFSFGINLNTASGPSVVLDGVDATHSDDLQVSWSVYRNGPDEMGFGMWDGPLRPRWPSDSMHGYHVAQPDGHPERGGTWLIGTVRAKKPGVYHVSDISIRYRSGPRTRHVSSGTDLCLLAASPSALPRIWQQVNSVEPFSTDPTSVDPLVLEYEQCSDPSAMG